MAINAKIEKLLQAYYTRPEGLTNNEVFQRLSKYGANELRIIQRFKTVKLFLKQFTNTITIFLIIAGIISLFDHEALNEIIIFGIIALVIFLGFIQEYRAERALQALKSLIQPTVKVLRDNHLEVVQSAEIVPGDILYAEAGDRIQVDGYIFDNQEVSIDESSVTGESFPVYKTEGGEVYSGTIVVAGKTKIIVTATGNSTRIATIAKKITEADPPSQLQQRTARLAKQLTMAGVILSIIIVIIGLQSNVPIDELIIVTLSLTVAVIPEGLPLTITIALAYNSQRLAQEKAIIRKIAAIDTLGAVSVVCTDKTGTLTKNEMSVQKIFVDNQLITVTGSGYQPKGKFIDEQEKPYKSENLQQLLQAAVLANNSQLFQKDDQWAITGDPTEGALIVAGEKAGISKDALEDKFPKVKEILFTSERKMMSMINKTNQGYILSAKGAPEEILVKCQTMMANGKQIKITKAQRTYIEKTIQALASQAYRVLALAQREFAENTDLEDLSNEDLEANLTFCGLIAMVDPPREEVVAALQTVYQAGIKVIMITGDNPETALAIAKAIGLKSMHANATELSTKDIMLGKDLESVSDERLKTIVKKITIFARNNPLNKLRIVHALQDSGHVVAMTGDGINDAPALKKADVGIAMGIKGTDVSKEASDLILQDDNFATIVKAIRMGRINYENIEKFSLYLISDNFIELLLILMGVTLLGFAYLPLLAIQVLFVNMFDEIFPAVALGLDNTRKGVMRSAFVYNKNLLSFRNLLLTLSVSLFSAITIFILFLYTDPLVNLEKARTLAFLTILISSALLPINFSSIRQPIYKVRFYKNKYLLVGVAISLFLSVAVLIVPFLMKILSVASLSPADLIFPILISILITAWAEVTKISLLKFK